MAGFRIPPPSEEESRLLYERLLEDDPLAWTDIALGYLDHLTAWLIDKNLRADEHLCSTAAEDAILALIKHPQSYKPGRQTLGIYLRLSALGDLKNLLRSERKHRKHQAQLDTAEVVRLSARALYQQHNYSTNSLEQRGDNVSTTVHPSLPDSVYVGLNPEEVRVLQLMQIKERRTHVYSTVLGISSLPLKQQQQRVKQVKDRLQKRIERAGGKL